MKWPQSALQKLLARLSARVTASVSRPPACNDTSDRKKSRAVLHSHRAHAFTAPRLRRTLLSASKHWTVTGAAAVGGSALPGRIESNADRQTECQSDTDISITLSLIPLGSLIDLSTISALFQ